MAVMEKKPQGQNTRLMHLGQDPSAYFGIPNPPVPHASTILYPDFESYKHKTQHFSYARWGTPLSETFEKTMAELESGFNAVATPSGLSAIKTVFLTCLKAGDHVLITDSFYPPARYACNEFLSKFGIEVEYYDPRIGGAIAGKIKSDTKLIHMESPGSATFEVQDVDAIVSAAKAKNITTSFDNSWSGGVLFNPLRHGVDFAVQSVSKYVGGHSDLMLGVAIARDENCYKKLRAAATHLGICAGPDDLYLALRGLRTLRLRMKQCGETALAIANWLQKRPEVQRVYCPGLESSPDHGLWKKYYSGHNGLVSFLLKPAPEKAVAAFCNRLDYFPIGSSWGGYESLMQPQWPEKVRTAVPWREEGQLLRIHAGLEDAADLIADLEGGFERFKNAS